MKGSSIQDARYIVQKELNKIQDKIYDLEKIYLEETIGYGNILKGWDLYINMKKTNTVSNQKKNTKITDRNRIFSLTSKTSKVFKSVREQEKFNQYRSVDERSKRNGKRTHKSIARFSSSDKNSDDDSFRESVKKGSKIKKKKNGNLRRTARAKKQKKQKRYQ